MCFVNHKATCVCVLKAADTVDYKAGRPSLIPERREGSCPARSLAQSGEKAHFLNSYFLFITVVICSSPEDVMLTPVIDGEEVMRHCHSLTACV